MAYDYQVERANLFSEEGIETLRKVEANVDRLLKQAGAFTTERAMSGISSSSWTQLAAVEYLAEKGKIRKVSDEGWGQHHVWAGTRTD